MNTTRVMIGLALAAWLSSPAAADDGASPRRPPQEAFESCRGKSSYEACSVTFGERAVAGTCAPAEDNTLFCRPSRPPGGPPRPPPEAFQACAGSAAEAACSVALRDRTVDGTCAAAPDGQLFCRPSQPPPQPPEAR